MWVKCKHVREAFVDFDNFHRLVSLRKLYSVTWTNLLKVKNYILETIRVCEKNGWESLVDFTFAIEWFHCENCTP